MKKRVLITLASTLWVLFVGMVTTPSAAVDESEDKPSAVTMEDPSVPAEELELMLKAFTKDELLVEADGWQRLLRAKVVEIGKAEIAVKRQNREIQKAQEVQDQAQKAKEQLEEVEQKAEEAEASGDAKKIRETEQAAEGARESVDGISEKLDEAAEAAEKTAEVEERMRPETKEKLDDAADAASEANAALDRVQEAAEGMDAGSSRESVRAAAGEAKEATQDAQEATVRIDQIAGSAVESVASSAKKAEAMDATAEAMAQAEEAKKVEKVNLLEELNDLRTERTQLIDNLEAVLAELESKTDAEDSDTLAKIKDYRLYIHSVQGIELDLRDSTSSWIAIKGWMVSDEGGLRFAKNILKFLGIIFLAWMVSKLLSRAVRRALGMTDRVSQLLEDFLVGSVRWVVMAIGIITALAAMEFSVGPLLAVVGAAGFVIAFALQDSLSNFASGIMILFFRPFDVGDVVDAGGVSGKVMKMNLVSTTIKTFDNKDMVVPNNKIWQDVITNATGVRTRRVDMEFGIGYDDDIDRAQEILEEIVANHPKAMEKPEPTIRMNTLADSSINFICRPWSKTEDYWDVYWDVTREVKRRFDAAGIGIPYPQRDVHLYIESGDAADKLPASTSGRADTAVADSQPLDIDEDRETGGSEG
jgi:small conductance mechanosensitive channel